MLADTTKSLKTIFYIKYFEVSETFRDIMWIFFFGIHKNKLLDDFVPTRYVLLSARYAFLVLPMIDRKLQLNKNISFLLRYLDQFS